MSKPLSFTRRHPLVYGIMIVIIFFLSLNVPATLIALFGPKALVTNGDWVMQGTAECFAALFAILTAYLFKLSKIWGEAGAGFKKGLVAGMYFLIISLYSLLQSLGYEIIPAGSEALAPAWKILAFTVTVFLIGFTEETFFRGIVANLFYEKHATTPAGVWTATIGSGFVFGMMHITNLLSAIDLSTGAFIPNAVIGVLVQTASACMMGMTLSAIYFRCRNIWALIFIHGFIDFCGAFSAGVLKDGSLMGTISAYVPGQILSVVPIYLIVTLWLLRPSKIRKILDYRRATDAMEASDEYMEPVQDEENALDRYKSDGRSVFGLVVAVVVAVFIIMGLFAVSMEFSGPISWDIYEDNFSDVPFSFSTSGTESGDGFTIDTGEFQVDESGTYTITVTTTPGSSQAYADFTILEDGQPVYNYTYSGRCNVSFDLGLKAGKDYSIVVNYDISEVDEPMDYYFKVKVRIRNY